MPKFRVPLRRTITEHEWVDVEVEAENTDAAISAALSLADTADLDWSDRGCGYGGQDVDLTDDPELIED